MKNLILIHVLLFSVIWGFAQTPVTLLTNLEYPKGLWIKGNAVYLTETAGRNTSYGGKICLVKYNLANSQKTVLVNNPVNSDAVVLANDGGIYLSSYHNSSPGEYGKVSVVDTNNLLESHLLDIEIAARDMFINSSNNIILIGSSDASNAKSLYFFPSGNYTNPSVLQTGLGRVWCVSQKDSNIYFSDHYAIKYFGNDGIINTFYNSSVMSISFSTQYLYYADYFNDKIGRINLQTNIDDTILTGLNGPIKVRFDVTTHSLYFLEVGTNLAQYKDGTLKVINGLPDNVEEFSLQNKFKLYPNPANNVINIEIQQAYFSHDYCIYIFSIQGQLLLEQPIIQEKTAIDISGLAKGIYILKLNNKERTEAIKIMKE